MASDAEYFRNYRQEGSQKEQAAKYREIKDLLRALDSGEIVGPGFWHRIRMITGMEQK